MSGQRLDADEFTKSCQKVEAKFSFSELDAGFKAGMAKYCSLDNIFLVGKQGQRFAYEMCDGNSEAKMRAKYQEGLRVFCTPSNAYRFGTSGGVYQDVCTGKSENDWLTEYRKGRKVFLNNLVAEKERQSAEMSRKISDLELKKQRLKMERMHYSHQKEFSQEQVRNPVTGVFESRTNEGLNSMAKSESERLDREISSVDSEINGVERDKQALDKELSKLRTEMNSL